MRPLPSAALPRASNVHCRPPGSTPSPGARSAKQDRGGACHPGCGRLDPQRLRWWWQCVPSPPQRYRSVRKGSECSHRGLVVHHVDEPDLAANVRCDERPLRSNQFRPASRITGHLLKARARREFAIGRELVPLAWDVDPQRPSGSGLLKPASSAIRGAQGRASAGSGARNRIPRTDRGDQLFGLTPRKRL